MNIIWHEKTKQFHLYNDEISYIIGVQITGELSNLYFGKRVHDKEDFSYLYEMGSKSMTAVDPETENYSMELNSQDK